MDVLGENVNVVLHDGWMVVVVRTTRASNIARGDACKVGIYK